MEPSVVADQWRSLCCGKSIGHKRIEVFEPVEVAGLRLTVDEATATAIIHSFESLFSFKPRPAVQSTLPYR
jgi:hypothetical protein